MGQYSVGQQWDNIVLDNSGQYSGGQQWDSIVVDNNETI